MKNNKKPVFTFKNADGVIYKVYYGIPTFSYRRNGKRNTIKVLGVCYSPKDKKPKIIISKGISSRLELATIIEEWAHSFFWDKKEKEVRPFATSVTKFLYKSGWRKVK